MPLFEYKAVAANGETVQGTMEAATVDMVVLKLQEAGNIPLHARESGSGGFSLSNLRFSRQGMNTREVGEFTLQLATLLGAGLPLDRSLHVLLDLSENERIRRTVSEIRDRVREGGSLSKGVNPPFKLLSDQVTIIPMIPVLTFPAFPAPLREADLIAFTQDPCFSLARSLRSLETRGTQGRSKKGQDSICGSTLSFTAPLRETAFSL